MFSWLMLADAAGDSAAKKPGGLFDPMTLLFIGAIFAVFYFFMIRPQKKRERERQGMLSQVKKGAEVRTIGGIYGRVVSAKEKFVILEIDKQSGATLKLNRAAVSEILRDEAEENGTDDMKDN